MNFAFPHNEIIFVLKKSDLGDNDSAGIFSAQKSLSIGQ